MTRPFSVPRATARSLTCLLLLTPLSLTACGGDDGGDNPGASGGSVATGGAVASGGSAITGGSMATGGSDTGDSYSYSACAEEKRFGGFTIDLTEAYTGVTGKVTDGIIPTNLPELVTDAGDCKLVRSRALFCDPECGSGETCGEDGTCLPYPTGQDVGEVMIAGLTDAVSMTARQPANNYTFTGTLPHPGFSEGDTISLTAAGATYGPFSLVAKGIAPLMVDQDELPLSAGQPAVVTWNTPAESGDSRVVAELNIALHGGTPVRIECDVEDTGRLEISSALIDELLGYGYSGFPAITITRQTADSVSVGSGCADLRVTSTVSRLPIVIEGLVSCSDSTDCPDGQTCQDDLTCQ